MTQYPSLEWCTVQGKLRLEAKKEGEDGHRVRMCVEHNWNGHDIYLFLIYVYNIALLYKKKLSLFFFGAFW